MDVVSIGRDGGARPAPAYSGSTGARVEPTSAGGDAPRGCLAVVGATATGKTALSLALAEKVPLEVISMDSRQVYRHMEIGTGKASPSELGGVPHWGIDVVDPSEHYSAGRFARDARGWIGEIRGRGRLPVLVGGTGFFLRALTHPVFSEPPLDPERLDRLRLYLNRLATEQLSDWVRVLDPARAELAVSGGRQRMSRTAEMALLTGRPLSWWHASAPPDAPPVEPMVVLLDLERERLYERIEERVRTMMHRGWIDEVRRLLASGYTRETPGLSAVGYREIVDCLRGCATPEEAASATVRATRRYARRQLTWFRNQLGPNTVLVDAALPLEDQVKAVSSAARGLWSPDAHRRTPRQG